MCSFFDDLRPYAVIQFMPCIVIPVMTIVIPPMYTHSSYWLWAVLEYSLGLKIEIRSRSNRFKPCITHLVLQTSMPSCILYIPHMRVRSIQHNNIQNTNILVILQFFTGSRLVLVSFNITMVYAVPLFVYIAICESH